MAFLPCERCRGESRHWENRLVLPRTPRRRPRCCEREVPAAVLLDGCEGADAVEGLAACGLSFGVLAAAERAVELVERALHGEVFRPSLQVLDRLLRRSFCAAGQGCPQVRQGAGSSGNDREFPSLAGLSGTRPARARPGHDSLATAS